MNESTEALEFPARINKYLAHKGYATRKGADALIERRQVFINGKVALLGDKVVESDVVEVRSTKSSKDKPLVYYAYNKPRNVITHSPQDGEQDIRDQLPELTKEHAIFPIGRLDKDSHGLILLTNDGRITDRLLNPSREHEKEYVVRTKTKLRDSFAKHVEEGVSIEGYLTKPAQVQILGERSFRITITEGKKHQIRRMVVALFNEVEDLERIRILSIELKGLKPGQYRELKGEELSVFLIQLGLAK